MKFVYNDGGRRAAGFKGDTGDCVTRAVAIASGRPYGEVYQALAKATGLQRAGKRGKSRASARNGISVGRKWFKDYMARLGFTWVPTMGIGTGCTVHLNAKELPPGRLVVSVSKHYTAVIDGVINDTHNPGERGATMYSPNTPAHLIPKGARKLSNGNGWVYDPERCVYGYWLHTTGGQ